MRDSRVLLIGCGALGTVLAEQLVRAGVGVIRICDRDVVEPTNLQRQVLFTEADATEGMPKAVAAARRLAQVNSSVEIDARVVDVQADNVEALLDFTGGSRAGVLLDGTDNADVRYLMNDVAVKHSISWVYGACVGTEGRVMPIRPGISACLRCVFRDPPALGELPTCDTAGVLGPAAGAVASIQAALAIKLLVGALATDDESLLSLDVWTGRFHSVSLQGERRVDCPVCGLRRFEFLDRETSDTAQLCGRNTIQIRPIGTSSHVDLDVIAKRLGSIGATQQTPHLVRCHLSSDDVSLTLFPDGRALIQGTNDTARARSLYARYVGA